jgi:PKD repeat protein
MTAHNSRFVRLVPTVALCLASVTAWALDPGLPPGSNFDLSHWKLQLPTSGGGNLTCTNLTSVDEKTPAQLAAGFTNDYFYTGSDGAMVFWAPVNGATTGGSYNPRSELRELITPSGSGTAGFNWIPYGTHILDAQCKVLEVSTAPGSQKKVIIGQIHGYSGAALPTVKLQYNNGTLEGFIKKDATNTNNETKFTFVKNVGLNSNITYQIKVVNGLITITMNGITNSQNIFVTDPQWQNETMYFKAGDYNQDEYCSNPSTNLGARVSFYAVTLFHAPSITNQPASQVVTVGSNVTFTVGAAGNPPLRYFWKFNGAPIGGNSATLSVPNVQLANAGSYSVIITDSVGTVTSVVTSSVATLSVLPLPPSANFTATPTNGVEPLTAEFTDASTGSPTNWNWDFGDAGISALQNPSHAYATAGVYTVRLVASNGGGSSTNMKTAYINVITPLQSWLDYYGVPGDSTDSDGDGMGNTNEFLAGFDPTNNADYLHIIGVAVSDNDVNITYLGANGDTNWSPGIASRTNVLEYSTGTADGGYTSNFATAGQTNVLSGGNGSGVITNMVDAGGATNVPSRYYRVRVLVP